MEFFRLCNCKETATRCFKVFRNGSESVSISGERARVEKRASVEKRARVEKLSCRFCRFITRAQTAAYEKIVRSLWNSKFHIYISGRLRFTWKQRDSGLSAVCRTATSRCLEDASGVASRLLAPRRCDPNNNYILRFTDTFEYRESTSLV